MTTPEPLTRHAVLRSHTRHIPLPKIEAVLMYGRLRRARGAEIYTLGWREGRRWAEQGIDLSRLEGIEVICGHDGRVITVYRNRKPFQARDRAFRRAACSEGASRHGIRQVPGRHREPARRRQRSRRGSAAEPPPRTP